MDVDEEEIDPVLVERFAHGNGTVFVGAGISYGSRLPLWAKLMEPLIKDLDDEIAPGASPLDIAELYETKHSRGVLVQYLKDRLGDVSFQLTKTHELIVSLPVRRIYTTNFDDLLEQASRKKQLNRSVIFNASQVGFADTSTLSIIKLHGDLNDPASLVISASDFYGFFAKNPAVGDLLKVELQTHTILFLGYSFSDPNLGMIIGSAAAQSGSARPLLYTLQLSPTELAVQAFARRGVKVIRLDAKPGTPEAYAQIEDWLDRFRRALLKYERRKHPLQLTPSRIGNSFAIPKHEHSIIHSVTQERIEAGLRSDFRVVIVKGEPGIGKTQLVAAATSKSLRTSGTVVVTDAFERAIWIRSSTDSGGPGHKLENILDAISNSIATFSLLETQKSFDKKHEVNRLLQEHKVVVVIEDLEDAHPASGKMEERQEIEEIKKWLEDPGPYANPKSRIIVTSRSLILPGFVIEIGRMTPNDARAMLKEHADMIMLRRTIPKGLTEQATALLAYRAGRNPLAIKLALGLINGSKNATAVTDALPARAIESMTNINEVVTAIIDASMTKLSPSARAILTAMLAFPEAEPVPSRLLKIASGMDKVNAENALTFYEEADACVRFGLVERDVAHNSFSQHRIVQEVLCRDFTREARQSGRRRLSQHLLAFLRDERDMNVVCRREIGDEYWNALVRDETTKVDPYWPIIQHVMNSAVETPLIAEFALLLTHYMDSRFLHLERKKFLASAITALEKERPPSKLGKKRRALLKIDALAWTYMEENDNAAALKEIQEGLSLIDTTVVENQDLVALANAWRARVMSSKKNWSGAYEFITSACSAVERIPKENPKPWIEMRVKMIVGDFWMMQNEIIKALENYRAAEQLAECYGGEGDGYQTSPRIALALLEQKGNSKAEAEASHRFRKLMQNEQVATGRLYGQYGLALIAARHKATREAIIYLQMIHQEIKHRGSGNVLLKLAEDLYQKTVLV